jgi:hypothetical protein
MKRFLCVLVLCIVATTAVFAAPPSKGIGVGISAGLPFHAAVTAEYNFGPAYTTLSLGYIGSFWVRAEGGYNLPTPFINDDLGIDLFLSVGGTFDMMFSESGTTVGIGIPVTWSYTLEKVPMKFFVKAGPQLFFGGGLAFMGTIGGMYVFKL